MPGEGKDPTSLGHVARLMDNICPMNDSERVETTIMDRNKGTTKNKTERPPRPPPGSCVAKSSQRSASAETGGNCKMY